MMEPFESWLAKTKHVPPKSIPWFRRWVKTCISESAPVTGDPIPRSAGMAFLKSLNNLHCDWQVLQAEQALKLYNYYLSRERHSSIGSHQKGSLSLEAILAGLTRFAGKKLDTDGCLVQKFFLSPATFLACPLGSVKNLSHFL